MTLTQGTTTNQAGAQPNQDCHAHQADGSRAPHFVFRFRDLAGLIQFLTPLMSAFSGEIPEFPPEEVRDHPARSSFLETLPVFEYNRTLVAKLASFGIVPVEATETCPVCFDDYCDVHDLAGGVPEDVDRMEPSTCAFLPCGHVFHRSCLFKWLQRQHTCPVCRFDLPESAETDHEYRLRVSRKLEGGEDQLRLYEYSLRMFRIVLHLLSITVEDEGEPGRRLSRRPPQSGVQSESCEAARRIISGLRKIGGNVDSMLAGLDEITGFSEGSTPRRLKKRVVQHSLLVADWIEELLSSVQ